MNGRGARAPKSCRRQPTKRKMIRTFMIAAASTAVVAFAQQVNSHD